MDDVVAQLGAGVGVGVVGVSPVFSFSPTDVDLGASLRPSADWLSA